MSDPDDLYTLRNLYWLGNYQVINFTLFYCNFIVIIYRLQLMKQMA